MSARVRQQAISRSISTRPINVGLPRGILTTSSFARLDEGVPESYQTRLEAWHMVFLPKFPAVFCIVN